MPDPAEVTAVAVVPEPFVARHPGILDPCECGAPQTVRSSTSVTYKCGRIDSTDPAKQASVPCPNAPEAVEAEPVSLDVAADAPVPEPVAAPVVEAPVVEAAPAA